MSMDSEDGKAFLLWLANWILSMQPKEQSHEEQFEDDFDRYGEMVTIRKQFKQFGIDVEDPELDLLRDKVWASNEAFPAAYPGQHCGQLVNFLTGKPVTKKE